MKTIGDDLKEGIKIVDKKSRMSKTFCFTVDDNIRFLKEIAEKNYKSIFEHPYLAMYKRLHEEFDLKGTVKLIL